MVIVKYIRILISISFPYGLAGTKRRNQIDSECFTCKYDKLKSKERLEYSQNLKYKYQVKLTATNNLN